MIIALPEEEFKKVKECYYSLIDAYENITGKSFNANPKIGRGDYALNYAQALPHFNQESIRELCKSIIKNRNGHARKA